MNGESHSRTNQPVPYIVTAILSVIIFVLWFVGEQTLDLHATKLLLWLLVPVPVGAVAALIGGIIFRYADRPLSALYYALPAWLVFLIGGIVVNLYSYFSFKGPGGPEGIPLMLFSIFSCFFLPGFLVFVVVAFFSYLGTRLRRGVQIQK